MVQTQHSIAQPTAPSIGERVAALDRATILSDLDDHGCATTGPLLTITPAYTAKSSKQDNNQNDK